MNYSFIIFCIPFIIKITSAFDENNQFKNDNYNNKHELLTPCGQIKSIVRKFHNTTKYLKNSKIPMDIIKKLSEVTSVSELYRKFVPEQRKYENKTVIKKSSVVPKVSTCATESRTISLRDDEDPNLFFFPYCTQVERCGGCCGSELLSCQPSVIEMVDFEVVILEFDTKFKVKEKKIMPVEQHLKCTCDCIIKEKDCIALQAYDEKNCQCHCTNIDDQNNCVEDDVKIWNINTCKCECIFEDECTTGLQFDQNTCRCELKKNANLE